MSKNTPKQGSFENFLKQKVNLGSWKTFLFWKFLGGGVAIGNMMGAG